VRRRFALLGVLVALGWGGGAHGQPAAPESARARQAELEAVRGEISKLTSQLDDLAVRAYGIQGELEKVALERRLQEQRVREARAEAELAAARVTDAAARVTRLETELAGERRRLESRLAGLYRIGRHGHARLVFALDAKADPLPAIRLLRYLVRRDASSIARFEDLRARLDLERRDLETREQEAAAWLGQQAARRDELLRLEQRQAALLAGTRREEARLAVRALELADRETQLAALLDALYGRSTAPLAGRSMVEFRGLLDWPVRGRISKGFGTRLDPRYKTKVPHNGVELETAPGSEVVAVYPGRVVYAADFAGYGPTVVVQHAGKVFSLYAGLATTTVARDALVSLRQALGRAGPRLYFEIRVENRPEDPRRWIR
jgi:septal ring factor EnvC (AmiA/AmiB activator)